MFCETGGPFLTNGNAVCLGPANGNAVCLDPAPHHGIVIR